jgi:hypothetical protein
VSDLAGYSCSDSLVVHRILGVVAAVANMRKYHRASLALSLFISHGPATKKTIVRLLGK